jgi:hypothetical protein
MKEFIDKMNKNFELKKSNSVYKFLSLFISNKWIANKLSSCYERFLRVKIEDYLKKKKFDFKFKKKTI